MQPTNISSSSSSSREMQSINTLLNHFQMPFDPTSSHDDFLEQMLSSINNPSSPWPELCGDDQPEEKNRTDQNHHYRFEDQSQQALLTTKFRSQHINAGVRAPSAAANTFLKANHTSVQPLFNGFSGSLGQIANHSQNFNPLQPQHLGVAAVASMNLVAPPSGSTGAGGSSGANGQPKQQRVRARRGQATDPHSIAERLRRERIAERMKALQELVPNANKTDKASMLDEIIDYVKFLQLQVKVLSISRLGGAAAVAPLVDDMSSELKAGGDGGRANGTQTALSSNNDNAMTVTEHQVAKLMEEDMGSAMQYLQGKGLCLMPISLATTISTTTCHSRNPFNSTNFNTHNTSNSLLGSNGGAEPGRPSSPNMSALSVQSATANGTAEKYNSLTTLVYQK